MKRKGWLLVVVMSVSSIAHAYELNGTIAEYGDEDGTYSVVLENDEGHEYIGQAEEQEDGSLRVSVQDDKGDAYAGVATDSGNNEYSLSLHNTVSGEAATGTADME